MSNPERAVNPRKNPEPYCGFCFLDNISDLIVQAQVDPEAAWRLLEGTAGLDAVIGVEVGGDTEKRYLPSSIITEPYSSLWARLPSTWVPGTWMPQEGVRSVTMFPWAYDSEVYSEAMVQLHADEPLRLPLNPRV